MLYHSVLQTLTNEQYYAFVNIGAKYPVLLVTDATYEYTDVIKAAMDSEVYYVWDGKAVDLGMIASTGTAYPVSYDETGIYVAGGHFVERYALDEENRRLYVAEAANVVYDEEGNETYSYGTDGELEIVEDATYFNELFEKYALTTLADFK